MDFIGIVMDEVFKEASLVCWGFFLLFDLSLRRYGEAVELDMVFSPAMT